MLAYRNRGPGGRGPWPFKLFEIVGCFLVKFLVWSLVVGKDKSFEFYRKIIELGPPTPQVQRYPCADLENCSKFKAFKIIFP